MSLIETKGAASSQGFGQFALQAGGAEQAEAIDFDGTNDYLRRTSDLVGNANGKIVTLSFWVWIPTGASQGTIYAGGYSSYYGLNVYFSGGYINVDGARETFGSGILSWSTPLLPFNTWINIVLSFDLSNAALRHSYINDQQDGYYGTYADFNLFLAQANHYVGRQNAPAYYAKARISNLFLDYTYRDLSIEANRRLFVTADLKPAAGQAALNPILYLTMDDPTAPGANAGTGGDFTLTGTVARSGRGPNQYNAPYSTFDGGADYLSRTTALTGIADSKTFTINLSFTYTGGTTKYIVTFGSYAFSVLVNIFDSLNISANNSAGTTILFVSTPNYSLVRDRNYTLTVSIDLANTANRHVYLNGVALSVTWGAYTNDNIDFALASPSYIVGKNISTTYFNGKIGAFWFNTSYIDLSVADNLAKFVTGTGIDAKPVDLGASGELPTGTAPIIYLPMYGNNAGKNYGTGGDFSVNSGPYLGARGPNEFWGNILAPANGGGSYSSNYLKRASSLVGVTSNKTLSASFFFRASAVGSVFVLFDSRHSSGASGFRISVNASNQIVLSFINSSSLPILSATTTSASIAANTWYHVCFSVDMSNSANRSVYVNGASITTTWSTYSNNDLPLADVINLMIDGLSSTLGNTNQTLMSEFYLNNSYIDFSQEANRLKFRDAFGNPVNLTQQIEDEAIPNPAVYMRFPPTAFGTNYGTGGDFTVNGTITDGGQL